MPGPDDEPAGDDRDPMVTPAGDGTPPLREHAVPELAMVRETHPATTRALIADGLDLVHRLPLTWAIVEAGDCVHQRPGIAHYLFDYSPDMEYLEIVGPADFKSIDVPAVCDVPAPQPWA